MNYTHSSHRLGYIKCERVPKLLLLCRGVNLKGVQASLISFVVASVSQTKCSFHSNSNKTQTPDPQAWGQLVTVGQFPL